MKVRYRVEKIADIGKAHPWTVLRIVKGLMPQSLAWCDSRKVADILAKALRKVS